MPTQSAMEAMSILRDGSQFQWYVIPMLAYTFYIYGTEIEKKNWNLVFAGLAFWGMDWFNEIWNALVFHFTNYAPVWATPGDTAFQILIGLNIEICYFQIRRQKFWAYPIAYSLQSRERPFQYLLNIFLMRLER